jgi:LEA14-like dessication related protein
MKRIIYLIIGTFAILLTLSSCAPDVTEGLDQSGLPKISDMQITITSTADRVVTFHMDNEGVVPIWIISATKIIAQNDCQVTFKKAGSYSVEVKAYNRNGVSDGSVVKDFDLQ